MNYVQAMNILVIGILTGTLSLFWCTNINVGTYENQHKDVDRV